ncbi:MAG: isoaspartyl peptidase/L-asparaginase family protein [Myxococcaceae bacterium]
MGLAIIVHGGAGNTSPDDRGAENAKGCLAAAEAGFRVLKQGGSALDACVVAAMALEDDPLFNAGTGAVLNEDGEAELDASVMDGETLNAGAVALVKTVKNPVVLARKVMEQSGHVLLAAEGAERFARSVGIAAIENRLLVTERALERWRKGKTPHGPSGHGTIGVAATDARGQVAAATSTGGTSNKRAGRIGDSPLIGCGTYADSTAGAASATGHGESIIKVTLTRHLVDLLRAGVSVKEACDRAVVALGKVKGDGGVIAVTPSGEVGFAFNTQRMNRAFLTDRQAGSGYLAD